MEAQIPSTDVYQGLAWAFVLNYLVPTLPGKIQRAVYPRKLRYRQLMSTKVRPGPLCWTTSDTGNRLPRSGTGLCVELPGSYSAWKASESSISMEVQIPATDVYQRLAWAYVLKYLVPTLPGKFQTAVYIWRLRYQQLMSTKVWPRPFCWTTWFLLCLVSFGEQYTYGSLDTGNWCLSRSGLGLCVEQPGSYLSGKVQRAVYLWRLRYRQLMYTKVWPGPLCWTTWFVFCLVSFREQYNYRGSDTGNRCLPRSGLGLCVELPVSYSAW